MPGIELNDETVLGCACKDSQGGRKRIETHKQATEAHKKSDIESLFAAYSTAVVDRSELENALLRTAALMGEKKRSQIGPIDAIRDIALEAIALARDVAIKDQ